MKKATIGILVFFVLGVNSYASDLLDENKIWILAYTDLTVDGEFSQFICGDTIIENKTYHKVYWNTVAQGQYYGGLREDDGKVYYKFNNIELPEVLLYDFNLNVNDTFTVYLNPAGPPLISKVLISKNLELEFGEERIVYNFDDGDKWIEGVGSVKGLVYHTDFSALLKGYIEGETILYCDPPFFENDCEDFLAMHNCELTTAIIEVESNEILVFPNPSSSLLTIDRRFTAVDAVNDYLIVQNSNGVKVLDKILVNGKLNALDVSTLPNGLYYISMKGKSTFNTIFVKI